MASDSDGVQTITQLVQAAIDNGASLRDLETASGGLVQHSQFDRIKQGRVAQWPKKPETLTGYSKALGVSARQVVLAFAAQFGLIEQTGGSLLEAMLPASTADLTPDQARAIAAVVRSITESKEVVGHGNPAAKNQAVPNLSERRSRKTPVRTRGNHNARAAEHRKQPIADSVVEPPIE